MNLTPFFTKAFEKRRDLFDDPGTTCFRLFNGAGDGVAGLTLDWYAGYILVQYFSPRLKDKADDVMRGIEAASALLPAQPKGVLLKNRLKSADTSEISAAMKSSIIRGSKPPEGYTVTQNGVLAAVDLVRGQSTGIFLDMREVRDRLAGYYGANGAVLNLFCYTALFSVHAIKQGTRSAVNVDLSRAVLQRARINYALNRLRVDDRDFITGDSLDWIRRFRKNGMIFSLVIFDPPTFSRNRYRTFSSRKNYRESLALIADLAVRGHVLTSVNSYSISEDEYRNFHPAGWKLEFFSNESSDFTHTGKPYLKTGLWKVP
ncbi:MAG: hypothetical protein A2176_07860 [Spirochaetes bacterium RBG_13_51_14]|nr:MAG: hypothetical protein A2176_07860 [Spirochaetes bacterium RBG_13_51_14]